MRRPALFQAHGGSVDAHHEHGVADALVVEVHRDDGVGAAFGSFFLNDIFVDGETSFVGPRTVTLRTDLDHRLTATLRGTFERSGGELVGGTIREIDFEFSENPFGPIFQKWRDVDWDVAALIQAVEDVQNGAVAGFNAFLGGFRYAFTGGDPFSSFGIIGTDWNDRIDASGPARGLGGKDRINGDSSANHFWGGDGADTLKGGGSGDIFNGEAGSDVIRGQNGQDTLNGGDGGDILYGGAGNDTLEGNDHADTLFGGGGKDALFSEKGDDFLYGGNLADSAYGGLGDDRLAV